nr:hypothetical protein [Acholeplasmatales bacterium]
MERFKFIRNVIIKYLPTIITCIGFVIVLVAAVILNSSYNSNMNSNLSYYEDGWTVIISGKEKEAVFPLGFDYDVKEVTIKNKLGIVSDTDCLILEYQYQDVDAYIDGELIYDFNNPKSGNLHTVLGTNILSIPLKAEYSNKTIELIMTPLRDTKAMAIKHMYITPPGDFLYSIYQNNIVQLVIATFLLVLGTFYLVIYITCKVKKFQFETIPSEFFFSFFTFSFFIALWII